MNPILSKKRYYTIEQTNHLDLTNVPRHVAFIPDGNRRWAKNQQRPSAEGHSEGSDNLIEIVKAGKEIGIHTFTFYLFSTENWNREQEEIDALMWLLHNYLIDQRETFLQEGARLHTIGELSALPDFVQATIEETKQITKDCNEVNIVFALNYGGRNEIKRAIQKIAQDISDQKIKKVDITEDLISSYLDTAPFIDPDLLIRTSGELRLSNYLLWQISYTELYNCDLYWPDFHPIHLLEAVLNFQSRHRRLGGS